MVTEIMEKYGEFVSLKEPDCSLDAYISRNNKRIRVIDYQGPDLEKIVNVLNEMGKANSWVTKIFAKVREEDAWVFTCNGFMEEGRIKHYFNGQDASIVSSFLSPSRRVVSPLIIEMEERIMRELEEIIPDSSVNVPVLPEHYRFTIAQSRDDFESLAGLYREVYLTYPFPIFEYDYLVETAKINVVYGLIYNGNSELVAAASAETDPEHRNAEMTDFATSNTERGKGLASILLKYLEDEMSFRGITALYTIARSRSPGINKVFKRAGYQFSGRLINNCHISGDFENMSIWCKINQ